MKKSLLALTTLALVEVASAQSSVTVFGVVDATVAYGKGTGPGSASKLQLTNSGYNSSRLGFRGTEDLGGGLRASFWLEAGLANDDGQGAASNSNNQTPGVGTAVAGRQGLTFNRRSWVSISDANMGELRLGRDYTPQFWAHILFDPFGGVGVGTTQTFTSVITGITTGAAVRASNSIIYLLPSNLGGVYGQAAYYMGENNKNGTATEDDGSGAGFRIGYANGPFDVVLALSKTSYATGDTRQNNLAGKWNFGPVQVMSILGRDRIGAVNGRSALLGATAPVGSGEIRISYSTYKTDTGAHPRTGKIALGYVHHLSKRTSIYTNVAALKNKNGAAQALNNSVVGAGGNQRSSGLDVGIKHSF